MNTVDFLKILDEACSNLAWESRPDGTTFCNFFCQQIAHACGIFDLDQPNGLPFLADHIGPHLREKGWVEISEDDAQDRANKGEFILAWAPAPEGEEHGHVAVVAPGVKEKSSTWARLVALVASIAKYPFKNRIGRVSEFFRKENKPVYLARTEA